MNEPCPFHKEIADKVTNIEKELTRMTTVTVNNGAEYKKHITEAVTDIWQDITILRDLNKVHLVFKKYKIYRLIAVLLALSVLLAFGFGITDILKLIKYI